MTAESCFACELTASQFAYCSLSRRPDLYMRGIMYCLEVQEMLDVTARLNKCECAIGVINLVINSIGAARNT